MDSMIVIISICILFLYFIGVIIVYIQTNNKMQKYNKIPNPQEISMLMRMIFLYPLFYPEIDTILKHCETIPVEDV